MKYKFYTQSNLAWKGVIEAVRSANTSIYIQMYIFVDDIKGSNDLISLLIEKALSGVSVKMVLDGFGSADLSNKAIENLRSSGVEILFFKKIFSRLHRKIIIVDEKIGFIGGVNIHKDAENWNDIHIRVEGRIVNSLIRSFRKIYISCGGKERYIVRYNKKSFMGQTRIWLLEHIRSSKQGRFKREYKELIRAADSSVVIATPYFLPDRWLIKILKEAIKRGVRVEIIVPESTDIWLITRANRRYVLMMSEFGASFFLTKRMNHAKLLLVDEKKALVGSQNIDSLSFNYNDEAGLLFDDPNMVRDLSLIVSTWKKESSPFDRNIHVNILDRILSPIIRFFQPFL